jgi:enoyl-CoA hydratase/carnithine racemase
MPLPAWFVQRTPAVTGPAERCGHRSANCNRYTSKNIELCLLGRFDPCRTVLDGAEPGAARPGVRNVGSGPRKCPNPAERARRRCREREDVPHRQSGKRVVDLPRLSVAELADGAADGPLFEASGEVREPLVGVDLHGDADAATVRRAMRRAHACDRLLVGIAEEPLSGWPVELTRALDLTLVGPAVPAGRECVTVPDPEERLAALHGVALRNPQACVVFAGALRMTEALPVPVALDAESLAYSTLLGGPEFRRWLDGRRRRPVPSPAAPPVLVDRIGDQLSITLNRPERRNAYGRDVRDALVEALRLAVLDATVARVVLDGAGSSFCSGGDLDEFGTTPDLVTAHLVRTRGGAGRLFHDLADRLEVRVHGNCVGAGIELPAFAGTVLADQGTVFRLPEIGMGLIPGAGGTVSIPRRIGRWRTLHLALTGEPIDVATALEWGLVDAATPLSRPE